MIEMYLLEQLDAFARLGTLSAAAEELHVTQPALSRSMRKLEARLGVALFERSSSRIALNETGRVAADQARGVLQANRDLVDRVVAFDRSLRTLAVGACAPFPLGEVLPTIQQCLPGMAVTSEVASDARLLAGLEDHRYQLVILHEEPANAGVTSLAVMDERLQISVPLGHPLADRASVYFSDIAAATILVNGNVGFWLDLCRKELPHAGLLVQEGIEQLEQVANASTLPVFSTDRVVARTGEVPGRVSVPIMDDVAHVTYRLACLASERARYQRIFATMNR